jgi:hypothetical protein
MIEQEEYSVINDKTTLSEVVQLAAYHLLNNGLDGFDFHIPGETEDGHK